MLDNLHRLILPKGWWEVELLMDDMSWIGPVFKTTGASMAMRSGPRSDRRLVLLVFSTSAGPGSR
jgi:hypothetical protein